MIRILYVDDEPDIREVACLAINLDPEFELRSCASGAEAVEVAPIWRPDLILLDFMMPAMDGPATLQALNARLAPEPVPVVFITARTQPADVERLNALGALGVISKPFDPMTLAATVRGFIAK